MVEQGAYVEVVEDGADSRTGEVIDAGERGWVVGREGLERLVVQWEAGWTGSIEQRKVRDRQARLAAKVRMRRAGRE